MVAWLIGIASIGAAFGFELPKVTPDKGAPYRFGHHYDYDNAGSSWNHERVYRPMETRITTAGGTIITATNQSPIKINAHTRLKRIAIPPIKSMAITRALDTTGMNLIVLADTNTPLKAIPTESLSN